MVFWRRDLMNEKTIHAIETVKNWMKRGLVRLGGGSDVGNSSDGGDGVLGSNS